MARTNPPPPTPIGSLEGGRPYYAPMGKMRYDGDCVQCHLCGRWLKMVGGSHLLAAHDMALAEYRELFKLYQTTTTAAPETTQRKRKTMLSQIASGERHQSVLGSHQRAPSGDGGHSERSGRTC